MYSLQYNHIWTELNEALLRLKTRNDKHNILHMLGCILRDPNCSQTLDVFHSGVEWAQDGKFSQQDVDEAKLSIFSAVDAPVAPSDKGQAFHKAFSWLISWLIIGSGLL